MFHVDCTDLHIWVEIGKATKKIPPAYHCLVPNFIFMQMSGDDKDNNRLPIKKSGIIFHKEKDTTSIPTIWFQFAFLGKCLVIRILIHRRYIKLGLSSIISLYITFFFLKHNYIIDFFIKKIFSQHTYVNDILCKKIFFPSGSSIVLKHHGTDSNANQQRS